MTSTDATSLERQLLRAEQRYFEQLNQQASTLKRTQELSKLQLLQAQEELQSCHHIIDRLDLQLRQAQEELAASLDLQNYLSAWQHQVHNSIKSQLKLLLKTLILRSTDRLRWLLPIGLLRRYKTKLRHLIQT